jgi:anhydro-N-acetylmuramic acid kinase
MDHISAIGLMSGTSLDGIDVALLNTDGVEIGRFGPTAYRPYSEEERGLLRHAIAAAANLTARGDRPAMLADAEAMVTRAHAEAVEAFMEAQGLLPADVGVIGFHGQTVLHRPERGLTLQLGDGQALASRLGIPVIYDMRAADVAAGGEGAPLVPVYHRALASMLKRAMPIAVVNIGGVANITYVDGDDELIACDTGPGNALLDDFLRLRTGAPLDHDGHAAAAGTVDEEAIARMLEHPYFIEPPPKSLDRNDFRAWIAEKGGLAERSVEDGAATLTALTATTIARIAELLPKRPATWIIAGGGTHNPTLMRMLAERVAPATLETADKAGWSVDGLEAQAFAYLAVRSLRALPLTYPGTTGVPRPTMGGVFVKP